MFVVHKGSERRRDGRLDGVGVDYRTVQYCNKVHDEDVARYDIPMFVENVSTSTRTLYQNNK